MAGKQPIWKGRICWRFSFSHIEVTEDALDLLSDAGDRYYAGNDIGGP